MRKIFDMDNPVMRALSAAADLIVLNFLALLCSLPLVTLGASWAALSETTLRLVRAEEGALWKDFFRAFRANLKKGIPLGLLFLLAAGLLYFDYLAALVYAPPLRVGVAAIAILVLGLAFYAFALLGHFDNTLGRTLKNAVVLAVGYFPRTAGTLVFAASMWMLCIKFWRLLLPVLVLLGLALPVYIASIFFSDVFRKLETPAEERET
ncbi:MAG: YesL family protein [Oscillospiraceae bacterium]|nr:YesL family protein [Oscillospiraceae bacterium]